MISLGSLTEFLQRVVLESLPVSLLKICVLIAVAYLLSRGSLFRRLFLYRTSLRDKLIVFGFFSALALLEWWINPFRLRNPSVDLLARQDISVNSGLVASVVAGLLVGPGMGFAVGFLTWTAILVVRSWESTSLTLNAAFFVNSGIAAMIGGLLGGWIMLFRPTARQQQVAGFMVGALSQAVWLSIGLLHETSALPDTFTALIAPWTAAILSGGLGVLFFLWIIGDLKSQQERVGSMQIERALRIANQTLPFLRQGLNSESAQSISEIVSSVAELSAVGLTDGVRILSHVGAGADHHHAGDLLPLSWQKESAEDEEIVLSREQIACPRPDCPLTGGVLSPLVHDGEAIGGVIIYGVDGRPTNPLMVRLGVGLAQFFSNYQVELAELERQTQAVSQAELKVLQSQVHPHFLFNVLNTLAALCEIDPKQAGRLTVKLGSFLRRSLRESPPPLIPLREEMENVQSYVEIEQARFQNRLLYRQIVSEEAMDALVPSFGLQILVENAVLHGTSKRTGVGEVRLEAHVTAGRLWCVVRDNGPGFTRERQEQVFAGTGRASGLIVLRERGRRLLGRKFLFRIRGRKGEGTTVLMALPLPHEDPPVPADRPSVREAEEKLLEPLSG
jgi:two-component system sensor histidine kinase LytS